MLKYFRRIREILRSIAENTRKIERIQLSLGRIEAKLLKQELSLELDQAEFQVFSQWGEDGIIQYLISQIPIPNPIFIEFGVENYKESNTRFLLANNNWSGLVIDGSKSNIEQIKSDAISWRHNLTAMHAFVTRENISSLIEKSGISGDIGILSIDIDGNDYWVWEAIQNVSPRIVIIEYNSLFGADSSISVPYNPAFVRHDGHYSGLYYGASIRAFENLAMKKGYSLVGSNSAGNNLFFVRNDCINKIPPVSASIAYRKSKFREGRLPSGELAFVGHSDGQHVIRDLPVVDVSSQNVITLKEALHLS